MPNIPINVYFWLLSGVTESYRATITEISYLELPSGNQSKNVIKPRRVAVTWVFLFCWHPLTSSNSVWVWASPLTALLPQPPETVLSHIAFTAGQWCYSTSDTKEKKKMHSYLRIGSLGQPLESSLKLHCSLLPHMKGFWSPVTPALAQPWCTLPLLHLDPHCHLDAHCQATYHLCLLTCPESRDHVCRQPTVLWVLCYPWFTKRDTK